DTGLPCGSEAITRRRHPRWVVARPCDAGSPEPAGADIRAHGGLRHPVLANRHLYAFPARPPPPPPGLPRLLPGVRARIRRPAESVSVDLSSGSGLDDVRPCTGWCARPQRHALSSGDELGGSGIGYRARRTYSRTSLWV